MIQPPSLAGLAAGSLTNIPFWDAAALNKVDSERDPKTGNLIIRPGTAPGIYTSLPESPDDPWPENISVWNTMKLGGMRAPGIVELTGGRARRIDANKVPGVSGEMPSFMGYDAGEFQIKITIWTPRQLLWLKNFLHVIAPPPSAKIQPVTLRVEHPALKLIEISDIYVHRLGIPILNASQGTLSIEIFAAEFLPPLYKVAGPINPGYSVAHNTDGTQTVTSKPLPSPPSTTSLGP